MKNILVIFLCLLAFTPPSSVVHAASECPDDINASWTDCTGTYVDSEGDKYVGEWVNGEKSGLGTFYFFAENDSEGMWEKGDKNGQGAYYYSNGDKYVGEFKGGLFHGQGTLYDSEGVKYVGGIQR